MPRFALGWPPYGAALGCQEGEGAVVRGGRLVDIASIGQAEVMAKKAEQFAAAE